uniref:C2H2-type domain-containing protein n=1 Tax=Bactrocera latifrons TaxID=174628 RepID=A0A0K8WBR4_BACLA
MSTTTVQKFYCGEVFITNTYCMILECKCCNEEFGVYSTFLDHIFEKHFDNWAAIEKSKNERKKFTTPKEKLSEQVLLPTEGNERITIESKTLSDEDLITEILEPLENDIADMEDDIIVT